MACPAQDLRVLSLVGPPREMGILWFTVRFCEVPHLSHFAFAAFSIAVNDGLPPMQSVGPWV